MSYTPTTWAAGDTVTAAKLNKLEQGIASGGVLVVNMVYDEQKDDDYTDKTWKEIYDAPMAVIVEDDTLPSGRIIKGISPVIRVDYYNGEYSVTYFFCSPAGAEITAMKLVTDSENGYLTWAEEQPAVV